MKDSLTVLGPSRIISIESIFFHQKEKAQLKETGRKPELIDTALAFSA